MIQKITEFVGTCKKPTFTEFNVGKVQFFATAYTTSNNTYF